MNRHLMMTPLILAFALAACDRPAVVAVPVAVPGPAGATGATGDKGNTGDTGKTGSSTTVIVVPPAASAPGG